MIFQLSLNPVLEKYVEQLADFQHVGDIEQIQVLRNSTIYLLLKADVGVGFFEVIKHDSTENLPYTNATLINVAYVADEFRGNSIFEKFIWFLKKHENGSKIILGDVHSPMMISTVKKLSKKFETSWVKQDQKISYNVEHLDQYYSYSGPTGWMIMLENYGSFENWPVFYDETSSDFRAKCDWLLEN